MLNKFALVAVAALAASVLNAATLGFDSAGDPVYGGAGSFDGKDGGTPATFGSWAVVASPSGTSAAGSFIGDSTTLAPSNSGGDINSSGVSFGLFGHSGATAEATRFFDAPLLIGQSFVFQLAVNFRNGNKGIDVRDANSNTIFNLNIGGDVYSVNNTPSFATTILFGNVYDPNTVFTVQLTQTSAMGGTWTITRSGGLSGTQSSFFDYAGVAAGFHLYNAQTTGSGAPEDNLFFNNPQIVPEPSTLVLIGGSVFLVALLYVRRRQE